MIKVYEEMSWEYWRLLGLWTNWVYLEYGHITRVYQPLLGAIRATDFLNKTTQGTYSIGQLYIHFIFPDVLSHPIGLASKSRLDLSLHMLQKHVMDMSESLVIR